MKPSPAACAAAFLLAPILLARHAVAEPEIAPALYAGGNLRVAIGCDVGFLAPPGRHRIGIEVPDCSSEEREIDVSPTHATRIDGDLAISSDMLKGTVGAPDGIGILLGAFTSSLPRSLSSGSSSITGGGWATRFAIDQSSMSGAFFSTTVERRYFAFGLDTTFGYGSIAGRLFPESGPPGPFAFTGSQMQTSITLRLGARLPLRYAALTAGSGIGGSMWITTSASVDPGSASKYDVQAHTPQGVNALWHVPLWAAVTLKPFCNWGVQVGASYNVEPTNLDGNFVMMNAALMWQPSAACTRTPSVDVSP